LSTERDMTKLKQWQRFSCTQTCYTVRFDFAVSSTFATLLNCLPKLLRICLFKDVLNQLHIQIAGGWRMLS